VHHDGLSLQDVNSERVSNILNTSVNSGTTANIATGASNHTLLNSSDYYLDESSHTLVPVNGNTSNGNNNGNGNGNNNGNGNSNSNNNNQLSYPSRSPASPKDNNAAAGTRASAIAIPFRMPRAKKVYTLSVGKEFTVVVTKFDGRVYSWGNNEDGQCGLGTEESPIHTPSEITSLREKFSVEVLPPHGKVSCGSRHVILIATNSSATNSTINSSEGNNGFGNNHSNRLIADNTSVSASGYGTCVSASASSASSSSANGGAGSADEAESHSSASSQCRPLLKNTTVGRGGVSMFAWGWNRNNQLGDGTNKTREEPIRVN
jgi:hypothetical protein